MIRSALPLFAAILSGLLATSAVLAQPSAGTIYVVRHANTSPTIQQFGFSGEATPLNAAGLRRTRDLQTRLGRDIDAVYSTRTVRTYQTACAVAEPNGLKVTPYDQTDAGQIEQWKARIASGQNILIVGHSNTIGDIVAKLTGQPSFQLQGNEFDHLFVVRENAYGELAADHQSYGELKTVRDIQVKIESLDNDEYAKALKNLSGVQQVGSHLLLATDEGTEILVADFDSPSQITINGTIDLGGDDEIDLECLAGADQYLYAAGSHSWRRRNINSKKLKNGTDKKTRKAFENKEKSPDREKNRERFFRLKLDPGSCQLVEDVFEDPDFSDGVFNNGNDILAPFRKLPGKENGVDIEGLAVQKEKLFIGLRSPVLRFGYVPVIVYEMGKPDEASIRYVQLRGKGIRAMTTVEGGFLLIAGPAGPSKSSDEYCLYFWDGEDCFPGDVREGRTAKLGKTQLLGRIPKPARAKPEGLTLLSEQADQWNVLVVYDGVPNGSPRELRAYKRDKDSVDRP